MVLSAFTIGLVLAGLVGGVLGAAIGALRALGTAGVVIVLGETVTALFPESGGVHSIEAVGVGTATLDSPGTVTALGLGPLLGPHVAFAGGVAAAAYAGRKRTFDSAFRYHQAKQIAKPFGVAPRTLLVGGAFGLAGVVLARAVAWLPVALDPIASAVVLSALLHRLVFGYPLIGRFGEADRSVLDMSPFENGVYWGDPENETAAGIAGRHVVEPWQPDYYEWGPLALLSGGVGIVAGILALVSGSSLLAFGVALASLFLVVDGRYPVPVTHHVALPAGIVAAGVGGSPVLALALAVGFGLLGGLFGELAARVVYAHGDTHFDPAFCSILLTSLLIALLAVAGVLDPGAIPY